MAKFRVCLLLVFAVIIFGCSEPNGPSGPSGPDLGPPTIDGRIPPGLTAHHLVARMQIGWNLGNTFDAHFGSPGSFYDTQSRPINELETAWIGGVDNATTLSLISAIRNAGFDTIRIPVTWNEVANPHDNWNIRWDWLMRVQMVVDWAINEGLFVILNTHHENRVLGLQSGFAGDSSHPGYLFVSNIWRQIAQAFIHHDERLIFAGLNEPRHEQCPYQWRGGTPIVQANVNALNQLFVDTVRATGGNNVYRILQIPTVAANASDTSLNAFSLPYDPKNSVNKLVLSVHTYSPFAWAHNGTGGPYPGPGQIISELNRVRARADELGVPVILGEWGSTGNVMPAAAQNTSTQATRDAQRAVHAEDYVRIARERGMLTVWWDNAGFNNSGNHAFGIIQRRYPHSISSVHKTIIEGMIRGLSE